VVGDTFFRALPLCLIVCFPRIGNAKTSGAISCLIMLLLTAPPGKTPLCVWAFALKVGCTFAPRFRTQFRESHSLSLAEVPPVDSWKMLAISQRRLGCETSVSLLPGGQPAVGHYITLPGPVYMWPTHREIGD